MNPLISLRSLAFIVFLFIASPYQAQAIDVYFSPRGGCSDAIIRELRSATVSVDVALYQLSYAPLLAALRETAIRGVTVRVLVNVSVEQTQPKALPLIDHPCVFFRADAREKIHHNKFCVVDGRTVLTGSFNWTENAELRNAENLLVIRDTGLSSRFSSNFQSHWVHSHPFVWKKQQPPLAATPATSPLYFVDRSQMKEFLLWQE